MSATEKSVQPRPPSRFASLGVKPAATAPVKSKFAVLAEKSLVPKDEAIARPQSAQVRIPRLSVGPVEAPDPTGKGRFQATGPWEISKNLSDEQMAAVNCRAKTVVVKAYAGTGKTTMAVAYAAARKNSRILYMPFGKTVQLEAQKRFPPNTWCQTIDSAAWGASTKAMREKMDHRFTPMTIRDHMNLRTNRQCGLVHQILNNFLVSAEHEFRPKHAHSVIDSNWRATDSEAAEALAAARLAWRRMIDPSDKMPIPGGGLLKLWSLSKPHLDYDHIIFDEAQDTNGVTADIISQQTHAHRLYVGDSHQSIYAFRGATNTMDEMAADPSATQFTLSKSWRFGPKIAEFANLILGEFKGETVPLQGLGKEPSGKSGDGRITLLARTNAQLFREAAARQGRGIYWAGDKGISGYNIERLTQAYNLYNNDTCTDPVLRNFKSWGEAQSYSEESRDPEVRVMVSLVDEFRKDTPDLVHDLMTNETRDEANAETTFSTGHKAKGLDWDCVRICEDFKVLDEAEELLAKDPYAKLNDQELNLLYVGFTRAKLHLQVNEETQNWIDNLDTHRNARQLAINRIEARRSASRSFMSQS